MQMPRANAALKEEARLLPRSLLFAVTRTRLDDIGEYKLI